MTIKQFTAGIVSLYLALIVFCGLLLLDACIRRPAKEVQYEIVIPRSAVESDIVMSHCTGKVGLDLKCSHVDFVHKGGAEQIRVVQ